MKHARTYVQLAIGIATYVAFRWSGTLTGWPNIPVGPIHLPVSGDSVQVILAAVASFLPNVIDVAWVSDAIAMPGRVKDIHGATVKVPVVAEKPPA